MQAGFPMMRGITFKEPPTPVPPPMGDLQRPLDPREAAANEKQRKRFQKKISGYMSDLSDIKLGYEPNYDYYFSTPDQNLNSLKFGSKVNKGFKRSKTRAEGGHGRKMSDQFHDSHHCSSRRVEHQLKSSVGMGVTYESNIPAEMNDMDCGMDLNSLMTGMDEMTNFNIN